MGKAFCFGDNIDTDVIVPGQFLNLTKPEELAQVCMYGVDKAFATRITAGDVFVAGRNFGCGSSREHAPISIKGAGVTCVIAESFARIFYRNAINIGLPVLESPEAARSIQEGDEVTVDLEGGTIRSVTRGQSFSFAPFPASMMAIIRAGGLVPHMRTSREKGV